MTNAEDAGYSAYHAHARCALLNGHAPARNLRGCDAIRWHMAAEPQSMIQMQQPASPERQAWMRGWDKAREEANDGR